ncbi:MAG: hypothetical protein GY884_29590, partial [Proteobacteria bacterium]|nr:hypothetical protein [Pseudomonadota bacterium]
VHPGPGSAAVRGALRVEAELGHGVPVPSGVRIDGPDERTWDLDCVSVTATRLSCDPLEELSRDRRFDLVLEFDDDEPTVIPFVTGTPREGSYWRVDKGVGVDPDHDTAASGLIAMMMMLQPLVARLPLEGEGLGRMLAGPVREHDDAVKVDPPGLTTTLEVVEVEHGWLGEPQDLFLPAEVDGYRKLFLITGVELVAEPTDDGLSWSMSGSVPVGTLDQIETLLGSLAPFLMDDVELDVDTNDDGRPDSASFGVLGVAVATELMTDAAD